MSNVYAEVIDLINAGNVDYRRIAIELAKMKPSLFLQLASGKKQEPKKKGLVSENALILICQSIKSGDCIQAIKTLRINTATAEDPNGLSLKAAKDIIMVAAGKEQLVLFPLYQKYVDEIINASRKFEVQRAVTACVYRKS